MDDSYFESDVNRDLKDIKRKIDLLFLALEKMQNSLEEKIDHLNSRVSKIEDEITTIQSMSSQVDDIDEQLKKFSTIPGNIYSMAQNLKSLTTSQMSSWHRIINTSIRKGDPIPFDATHSKII